METSQLGTETVKLWDARVAGALHSSKRSFSVSSPVTGHVVANVVSCGREQVLLAIEGACLASHHWRRIDSGRRTSILQRWGDLISRDAELLSSTVTLETGKPLREARAEVSEAIAYAGRCSEVSRFADTVTCTGQLGGPQTFSRVEGIGTVLAVTTWCQPVLNIVRRAALALASGCQLIVKPSSRAPLAALMLADLWSEAGGPMGTFQVLPSEDPLTVVGTCLRDPRIRLLAFTGSNEVGQHLARQCIETGTAIIRDVDGLRPIVVLPDADLTRAADAIISCSFLRNSGQDCTSANTLFVHEDVAERLLGMLRAKVQRLRQGDPRDPEVQMGPLVDSVALTLLREQIEDAVDSGAQLVVGGGKGEGLRIVPAILDRVRPEMAVATGEHRGPVLPTIRFADRERFLVSAIAATKGTTAWVWSADLAQAAEVAEELSYDRVWINDVGHVMLDHTGLMFGRGSPWLQAFENSPYLKATHHTFGYLGRLN